MISSRQHRNPFSAPGAGKLSDFQQRQLCTHLLVQHSPGLQLFVDPMFHSRERKFRREFDPVFNLGSLRHLSFHCFKPADASRFHPTWLERISRMQHLRILNLYMAESHHYVPSPISLGDFLNLRSLTKVAPIPLLSCIFRSLRYAVLESVTILIEDRKNRWDRIEDCIEVLISHTKDSLNSFHLLEFGPYRSTPPLDTDMVMLQPLTLAQYFRTCDINLNVRCTMSNEDISTSVHSCPKLETLSIRGRLSQAGDVCPGVESLLELGAWCPRLHKVALPILFEHTPPLDSISVLNFQPIWLLCDHPDSDDLDRLKEVAMLFLRFFPRFKAGAGTSEDLSGGWCQKYLRGNLTFVLINGSTRILQDMMTPR